MKKKQRVDVRNASIIKRTAYANTLNEIETGGFCPFCEEHLFKHHRRPLVYTSKHWLVTENAWPYEGSSFHFLFIMRAHVEATEDMSPAAWTDLFTLYRNLVKLNRLKGATLMMRSGDTKITGASVNHLHAHLVTGAKRTTGTKPIRAVVGFGR